MSQTTTTTATNGVAVISNATGEEGTNGGTAHRFSLSSPMRSESAEVGESSDIKPNLPIHRLETKLQKMTDPEKMVPSENPQPVSLVLEEQKTDEVGHTQVQVQVREENAVNQSPEKQVGFHTDRVEENNALLIEKRQSKAQQNGGRLPRSILKKATAKYKFVPPAPKKGFSFGAMRDYTEQPKQLEDQVEPEIQVTKQNSNGEPDNAEDQKEQDQQQQRQQSMESFEKVIKASDNKDLSDSRRVSFRDQSGAHANISDVFYFPKAQKHRPQRTSCFESICGIFKKSKR